MGLHVVAWKLAGTLDQSNLVRLGSSIHRIHVFLEPLFGILYIHLIYAQVNIMEYKSLSEKPLPVTPRIIIHGGAGNITRDNLPPKSYSAYRESLLSILSRAEDKLRVPGAAALDVATFAVSLLEENPLFNAGRGAVYTTNGTHELEASVMVSKGYIKRGCGVMKVTKAKSPIKLAREMLVRGELQNGGGAQGHCQLEGETCDRLNAEWGLEMARPSYFWTRRRWDEHRRGLGLSHDDATYDKHKREADQGCADALVDDGYDGLQDPHWDGKEYLPQGTVGAVVLDSSGTVCAATSTGGLTNKLPGRIGDTPTLGMLVVPRWHRCSDIPSQERVTGQRNGVSPRGCRWSLH
jgi:L-asparaginase